jgi:hypothetical protein
MYLNENMKDGIWSVKKIKLSNCNDNKMGTGTNLFKIRCKWENGTSKM